MGADKNEKIERLLNALREELKSEPGYTADYVGQITLNVTMGGLNGATYQKFKVIKKQQ